MSPDVVYQREEDTLVLVEELVQKILNEKVFEAEGDSDEVDLDVSLARQALGQILQSNLSDVIEGLILIKPESVAILATLIYTGLKLKGCEYKNNLILKEVGEGNE